MQSDRKRLGHRSLGRCQIIGQMTLAGHDGDFFAEGTLDVRKGHSRAVEPHVQALVRQTTMTFHTVTAGAGRGHGHQIADLQVRHVGPEFGHPSGNLVAQNHGFLKAHGAKAAVVEIVQVRAANPAALHPDADIGWAKWICNTIGQAQVLCAMGK